MSRGTTALVGTRRTRRGWGVPVLVIAAGLAALLVVVAGVIRFSGVMSMQVVLGTGILLLLVALLFALPVHTLPAVALVAFAVVPLTLVPSDGPFNAFPPMSAILVIWVLRRVVFGQRPAVAGPPPERRHFGIRYAVYVSAALLLGWTLFSTARAAWGDTSVGWTVSFTASALCVLLVFDARREAAALMTAWIAVGGALGVYAFVELALGASPLYGTIYSVFGGPSQAPWAVYRAEASFGHPLFAGAFLTIPAVLGVGAWLRSGRTWQLLCAGAAALGVTATVSRGSIIAMAIALGLLLIAAPFVLGRTVLMRWTVLVVIAAVGAIGLSRFEPLLARQESMESALSLGARDRAWEVGMMAAEYSGWLGTGPGTSGITGRLFDPVVIENSGLQILISLGIPGLVLFSTFLGTLILSALGHRNVGVAAAIVGYTISITGFNSLDAVRSMHVIFGLLAILALHVPIERVATSSDVDRSSRDIVLR